MKIILMLLFSFSALACPVVDYPDSLSLEEKYFSIGTDFSLSSGGKDLGKVVERVVSFSTTFEFLNPQGQVVVKGKKAIISIGSKMDLYDCEGKALGSIEEEVLESFFSIYTKYSIKDPSGREIARSNQTKIFGSTFELSSPKGTHAVISRPMLRIKDNWKIDLKNKDLDPRYVIMVGAFKTASDNAKSAKNSKSKK